MPGKKIPVTVVEEEIIAEAIARPPSVIKAFFPVAIPIILIAVKSFLGIEKSAAGGWLNIFSSLGDPVIALSIGVLLAFNCGRSWTRATVSKQLQEAAEKAGGILVIIGAGGAFGAVLAATKIGEHFSEVLPLGALEYYFLFY